MKSLPAYDRSRLRLFMAYATLRVRLFLREILELHQRFLVGFLYLFGLVLSGNEQLALKQSLAHLLSMSPWTMADLVYLIGLFLYGWVVAAVVRRSARGGRVHHFAESLPLPFLWERLIRFLTLNIVNLTLLILFILGWHQQIRDKASLAPGLLLGAAYYIWIVGLQLSLLEQNWRLFPAWFGGACLLVLSKGTTFVWPMLGVSVLFALWAFRREETPPHDHPDLPLGSWETRWRSALTRRIPAQLMMQVTYSLARPALLIYSGLVALGLDTILYMVLIQDIPDSQKIHVYTVITGFLSLLFSSFFRSFYLQREEWQTWLTSLPRPESWWLRQDTGFVITLYLVMTVPLALTLVLQKNLSAWVPFIILPVHVLSLLALRHLQRSRHLDQGILIILGSCVWFILLGYLCDHAVQGMGHP
ncbi:hypothetical protein [Oligoflexus tunisiensis]|uniref:hypothetical protein n=1 Tax=Oligoflexus tunisiensis TaxID=708132 RepID=UPI00114C9976|nr:hypothetical protein [Oligoflexus tunisiensis]